MKNEGKSYIMDGVNCRKANVRMKRKVTRLKKRISSASAVCLSAALMAAGLTACAAPAKEEGTTVSVSKEGTVSLHIIESFDKPYYDQDELQQMILSEAADYNREVGAGNVSVEKIVVEDNMAVVDMTYASAADYAGFQGGIFFLGTAKEAQEAGYELNVVLSGAEDELKTIGMSDMLAMSEYQLLITDMKETVTLNGKAEYVSDNVIFSENRKTVAFGGEEGELAYVMYR